MPHCPVRAIHGDTAHLADEVESGELDAAIVTLPISNANLHVEELHHDRLVVCLRQDHPLASKGSIHPSELEGNLTVLYHPRHHPSAHARLLEMFNQAGVKIEGYSRASHPSEMQELVKQGYGLGLIREGTKLDAQLTTKPITGVDWTVDTAFIYNKRTHPKTVPVLLRHLKQKLGKLTRQSDQHGTDAGVSKRSSMSVKNEPEQLSLLA